jgi:hypothetical protein
MRKAVVCPTDVTMPRLRKTRAYTKKYGEGRGRRGANNLFTVFEMKCSHIFSPLFES